MIRAIIETSLIDWDGKITTVLFLDKCNFMCPFCQNWELILYPEKYPEINFEEVKEKLAKKKGWIDGVVLTGGEPLMNEREIFEISQGLKELSMKIKVDTNGAYPNTLHRLADEKLIDYVAMDVKAPLDERYNIAVGKDMNIEKIEESIEILMHDDIDYEFRTTCVPGIINEQTVTEIGRVICGAKKWALQALVPDNAYREEYRRELGAQYYQALRKYQEIAQQYVANVVLRGKTE